MTNKTKEFSKSLQSTEFRWITEKEARYAHYWQINKYGGNPGPPGEGALEAAFSWQHSIKLTNKTKEFSKSLQSTKFRWITEKEARYAHLCQINKYGGNPGPPGEGALEAALFRPRNHCHYSEPKPTIFELAAYYVWGIVNNHPFADGNKRTALAVALVFLKLNGYKAEPEDDEALEKMRATASFEVGETELAEWLERISFPEST